MGCNVYVCKYILVLDYILHIVGNLVLVRYLLARGANMHLKSSWPTRSHIRYNDLPELPYDLDETAVFFACSSDQSQIVELLLEHNLMDETDMAELVQCCMVMGAKKSLETILSKVPTEVGVLRHILLTACCRKSIFVDILVQHGAKFDQDFLRSDLSILDTMYESKDVRDTCCSMITRLILQEASQQLATSLVNYSTLMALIGRMTQRKDMSASAEEHRLFHEDIQACLSLLIEANPRLVTENPKTVEETLSYMSSSVFRSVFVDTIDMHYFMRFIIKLLCLGSPAICHVENAGKCALHELIMFFSHTRPQMDISVDGEFLFLLKTFLNSGCDPNFCRGFSSMCDILLSQPVWNARPLNEVKRWRENFIKQAAQLNLQATSLSMMRDAGLQLDRKKSDKFLIQHLLEIIDKGLDDQTDTRPVIHMCAVHHDRVGFRQG